MLLHRQTALCKYGIFVDCRHTVLQSSTLQYDAIAKTERKKRRKEKKK